MMRESFTNRWFMSQTWVTLAMLASGLMAGPAVQAQVPSPSRPADPEVVPAYAQAVINGTEAPDSKVIPASCSSCGGLTSPVPNLLQPMSGGDCACSTDTCGSCACKPGKPGMIGGCPISDCNDSCLSRLFGGFTKCLCCPDPCYEPVWVTTANSAFFMDTVRPRTYTRVRWDAGRNLTQPDRAEFFWAKASNPPLNGRGPRFTTSVDYDDLTLYQETASGAFSFFVETLYRGIDSDANGHHANFGDINLGTKSLFIDCELMQVAFQFRTYIPAGLSRNGLGTGHTALEPSLLSSVKLMTDTYLQGQVAYWIPLGGDGSYQGATWVFHSSLNHLWCKKGAFQLISTAEVNGWTFTDGAVTNRVAGNLVTTKASGESYVSLGGGLRVVFCDNMDIGFGAAFAVTDDHFADQLYRTEFRLRY